MSYSSTALQVTTPQGFHSTSQMTLRPTYPFSASTKIWARFNSILHSQKVLDLLVLCIIKHQRPLHNMRFVIFQ